MIKISRIFPRKIKFPQILIPAKIYHFKLTYDLSRAFSQTPPPTSFLAWDAVYIKVYRPACALSMNVYKERIYVESINEYWSNIVFHCKFHIYFCLNSFLIQYFYHWIRTDFTSIIMTDNKNICSALLSQ